jgi:hypothetical protein
MECLTWLKTFRKQWNTLSLAFTIKDAFHVQQTLTQWLIEGPCQRIDLTKDEVDQCIATIESLFMGFNKHRTGTGCGYVAVFQSTGLGWGV